jgi:U2 small nuclear ribonucleoprotein A'
LGTTRDRHDTLDLSDNELRKLENFPTMKRLTTLLLANNLIRYIEPLHTKLPYLHTLILTNNLIEDIQDSQCLQECAKLRTLSLIGNPVVSKMNYRLAMIKCCPQLTVLDFQKITEQVCTNCIV